MTTAKRALVLSGGGAKGAFEAGVLAACQRVGLAFDVITGSSVGAVNAVVYAEYLRRLRQEPERTAHYFDCFVRMWEQLDAVDLMDFDQIEPLIRDLSKIELALDDLLMMWWGLTDESRWERLRGAWHAFCTLTELDDVLSMGFRDYQELYEVWREGGDGDEMRQLIRSLVRRFLEKHKAERSLLNISSVRNAMIMAFGDGEHPPVTPKQGLSTFRAAGIDVRLTRTNVRSGKLELSAYHTLPEVIARLELADGHAGGAIVGDPNAWAAALSSGAFPVAFEPVPLPEIYPLDVPENRALFAILAGPEQAAALGISRAQHETLAASYPLAEDVYMDGSILDNRPLSAAIAALRDAAQREKGLYEATHDVFVVFLGAEPRIRELAPEQMQDMLIYEYGLRAAELMQNSKLLADISSAQRVTHLLDQTAGWKDGRAPRRVRTNVIRIFPQEMLTSTLAFNRRLGFSPERNRRLIALGCRTMLETLAVPETRVRLERGSQSAIEQLCEPHEGLSQGWYCRAEGCQLRDSCRSQD